MLILFLSFNPKIWLFLNQNIVIINIMWLLANLIYQLILKKTWFEGGGGMVLWKENMRLWSNLLYNLAFKIFKKIVFHIYNSHFIILMI